MDVSTMLHPDCFDQSDLSVFPKGLSALPSRFAYKHPILHSHADVIAGVGRLVQPTIGSRWSSPGRSRDNTPKPAAVGMTMERLLMIDDCETEIWNLRKQNFGICVRVTPCPCIKEGGGLGRIGGRFHGGHFRSPGEAGDANARCPFTLGRLDQPAEFRLTMSITVFLLKPTLRAMSL